MFEFLKRKPTATSSRKSNSITLNRGDYQALKQRAFDAAKQSRLRTEWTTENQSIDYETRTGLATLRARSRDAEANNGTAKKYFDMAEKNVAGPFGFTLFVRAMQQAGVTVDKDDSKVIRDAFYDWAKPGNCDVTGKLSFTAIQQIMTRARFRDGEYLVRVHRGAAYGKYGLQLQLLDTDRLDIELNKALPNGNVIRMGVEMDGNQKPIAYYIRVRHPGDMSYYGGGGGNVYERVPASDIHHHFKAKRPEQTRGVPEAHAALITMEHGHKFKEAALVAAEEGAKQGGFWTSEDGTAEGLADDEDEQGTLYTDVETGQIGVAPPGYEFSQYESKYPSDMYGAFVKENKRDIASSLDVAYHVLGNDLEGVNFSSIRAGTLDERDGWMTHQEWFKEAFLDPLYTDWITMSLLMCAIKDRAGKALPSFRIGKYKDAAVWMGRRWPWVDPFKDMQTAVLGVNNRLKTRTQVMNENGNDFDDSIEEMRAEDEKMKAAGVVVAQPAPKNAAPPQQADDE